MTEKFIIPKRAGNFLGCELLGRMVHVDVCRAHSQGLVKEHYASEFVLENCKGCARWKEVFPEEAVKAKARPRLGVPQAKVKMGKSAGRKKLSL